MALIEIRRLTKLYRMGDTVVRALDGVDLTIEAGEFVAITGPSGSGKSTMMHLLGCLDRPTDGAFILNGQDVSDLSDRALAEVRSRSIGFVFQTFNLINRTSALDNVGVPLFYARKFGSRAARKALERVGLGHRLHHRPNELSGGERQRVAIARAIVNEPVLILADEPTGNLDSRTGEQIMQIFHDLNAQGVTVVLVTHEPDVAAQARRVIMMRDGKIVSDRPSDDLPAAPVQTAAHEVAVGRRAPALAARAPAAGEVAVALAAPAAPALIPVGPAPMPVPGAADGPGPAVAHMRPRVASGATGVLVSGVTAITLLLLAGACLGLTVATGWRPDPEKPSAPPPEVVVPALGFLVAIFFSAISAVVALFWWRVVARRVRTEPGNWLGLGRARVGGYLGLATLLLPVVLLSLPLMQKLGKLLSSTG